LTGQEGDDILVKPLRERAKKAPESGGQPRAEDSGELVKGERRRRQILENRTTEE